MKTYRASLSQANGIEGRKSSLTVLLPLVAVLGCSKTNESPPKNLDTTPVVSTVSDPALHCDHSKMRVTRRENFCTTDCGISSPDEIAPFNSFTPVFVADCSTGNLYHKFVYGEDGKLLWEGIGNSEKRVFIQQTGENEYLVKVSVRYGIGWVTDRVTREDGRQAWTENILDILASTSSNLE